MPPKVYLAGPIFGCSDKECMDWRKQVAEQLKARGVECLDPTVRDYRDKEVGSASEIVEPDKKDIDSCNLVLAYCPKPSVGTSMEIIYAHSWGKPVISVVPHGAPCSPWIVYHSWGVVADFPEAVAAIFEYFSLREIV